MKDKLRKEWFLTTKWGKLAMISWGDRHQPGVLLVHGYMDSAASFEPLLSLLPDTYHYVSFDFPGHGKSDHVLTGQMVPQSFIVEIIKEIDIYLQWKSFICIAHSLGCLITLLFHHLYPGRIKKFVCIDPLFAVAQCFYMNVAFEFWFKWYYEYYYDHYHLYNGAPPRLFTREQLIESTMNVRNLSREQAETVLSRSLVPVENGMYRLSTQPIMRRMVNIPTFRESFRHIITHNIPPILYVHSKKTHMTEEERKYATELFSYDSPTRSDVYIDADHDLHVTHSDELVQHIVEFLNRNNFKAKL